MVHLLLLITGDELESTVSVGPHCCRAASSQHYILHCDGTSKPLTWFHSNSIQEGVDCGGSDAVLCPVAGTADLPGEGAK